jgi:hypothetical protein
VQIRGFCNHESFGGTGSAIPPRVNQYRIATMKRMGANGWRGAHEPPAEDLLDAADVNLHVLCPPLLLMPHAAHYCMCAALCPRSVRCLTTLICPVLLLLLPPPPPPPPQSMGFLMWIENREFGQEVDGFLPEEQTLRNIADMVQRSRNHPSVIMWSLCNEGGCIQRSQQQAIAKGNAAKSVIRSLDTTRPMTAAINYGSQGKECEHDCLTPTLDVIGTTSGT